MKYYQMYGMLVASEIPFPEADEIEAGEESQKDPTTQAEAEIRLAKPPEWVQEQYGQGSYSHLTEDVMWFRLEDQLLIYVEKGKKASVWKLQEDLPEPYLRTYVLTGAITFLLMQRRFLPVHGSGLACGGQGFIVTGGSGSGKSTTAMELMKRPEIQFVTDDISPLKVTDEICELQPGIPYQKVCPDVYQRQESQESFEYIQEQKGKYGRRLKEGYVREPLPVRCLFELVRSQVPEPIIEEMVGLGAVDCLTHNLFRGELYHVLGLTPWRMQMFLQVAKQIQVFRVYRPMEGDSLEAVTQLISNKIFQLC